MRVLLIEDDSAMARSIELMLRSEGLNVYITDPHADVPGTKMIFPGIKSDTDRQNLIAYLATLK